MRDEGTDILGMLIQMPCMTCKHARVNETPEICRECSRFSNREQDEGALDFYSKLISPKFNKGRKDD